MLDSQHRLIEYIELFRGTFAQTSVYPREVVKIALAGNAAAMVFELVLDALEQAIWSRSGIEGVVHRGDRGSQYLSIRYSERMAEAGAQP